MQAWQSEGDKVMGEAEAKKLPRGRPRSLASVTPGKDGLDESAPGVPSLPGSAPAAICGASLPVALPDDPSRYNRTWKAFTSDPALRSSDACPPTVWRWLTRTALALDSWFPLK